MNLSDIQALGTQENPQLILADDTGTIFFIRAGGDGGDAVPVVCGAPDGVLRITTLTQEEYDELDPPDPKTYYIITDAEGIPGPDGLSAYELAVENGFEGTVEEWLASLAGGGEPVVHIQSSLGTTTEPGFTMLNTTPAAAGAQQVSPAYSWVGQGWKTASTAASQPVEFRSHVLPVQGTAAPGAQLIFSASINEGPFTNALILDEAGNIYGPNSRKVGFNATNCIGFHSGILKFFTGHLTNIGVTLVGGRFKANSSGGYTWGASANADSIIDADTGFFRAAAGTVALGNGTIGDASGTLQLADLTASGGITPGVTEVGLLPAASAATYQIRVVTDSLSPVAGATVSAGGSAAAAVMSNGTDWLVLLPL